MTRSTINPSKNIVSTEDWTLPPASLDLSIITVNYKSTDYLMACVASIVRSVKNLSYEIIVVDNDSQDDCAERLSSQFPEIIFIGNDENVGFSRANNQGIQISKGNYVLLLNNDTVVHEGSLEKMHSLMQRSPEVGLLGCRLANADGTMQQSFGRALSIVNEIGRKCILNPLLRHQKKSAIKKITDRLFSKKREADWICGACMFFRRKTLQEVGLLDENFFMYMEDVDLGMRVKRAGWKVKYTPEATITHFGGGSVPQNYSRTMIEYRRSQLYFYKKHYGSWGLVKLKTYLYLKMAIKLIQSYLGQIFCKNKSVETEQLHRFHKEVYGLIRDYH